MVRPKGRPKGGTNRYWSKEEKLRIVKRVIKGNESQTTVAKSEQISDGMLSTWIKKYLELGDEGLLNKVKPGNPLAKYQNRNQLTKLEQLEFENMKLRIENERLKKGYIVEGVGQVLVFSSSKDKNIK